MHKFYHSPLIIPSVQPDYVGQGVQSDHSVPLCLPNINPCAPAKRNYVTITSRPLPESQIRLFGQWLIKQNWDNLDNFDDPCQQVEQFESIMSCKIDEHFPVKTFKKTHTDKPFITAKLKRLKRQRMREYCKNGKSIKYKKLAEHFTVEYYKASKDYLRKSIDSLKESNPGRMYKVIKKVRCKAGRV